MSSWNPPPEGSGGWTGDPGQGYGQPGVPGPGYEPPPGSGLPAPQGYGVADMGGYQPPGRRRGIRRRLGIGGIVLLVVIIAVSVVTYQHENHPWKLTAPSTAAGLQRDTDPLDTLGLSAGVTGARSAITNVKGYGKLKSSVSAAYLAGSKSGPLVWFIGFNGTFSEQIVLRSYQGARIVTVDAGPHGGVAECASTTTDTFCQWSTTSTLGDLIITSSDLGSLGGGPVSTATADSLLIKMRNSVEHSA